MAFHYRYKAKDWQGNMINENISAASENEVLARIHSRGLIPLDIKKKSYLHFLSRETLLKYLGLLGLSQYSSRDLMIFCRQFSTMLKAGVSALHALNVLAGQMENRAFRARLASASLSLREGSDLAGSFKEQNGFFPPLLINMVAAAEAGGVMDTIMERMALHYENQHDMEEKIRSATAYPLFITAVAIIVILVMVIFVLPQFANIFNSMGMEMPLFSRILLKAGESAANYWYLFIAIVLSIYAAFRWYAKTKKGRLRIDRLRLSLPIYGKIYSQNSAARFARTLGTLLAAGVTLHSALELADKTIGNAVISATIKDLGDALNSGETLAAPMSEGNCFPPLLIEMVRVGEETGTLDQTLGQSAIFYEKEVSYIVERLGSILEPLLLLAIGLFIGLLVFSILSPMYQVFQMI